MMTLCPSSSLSLSASRRPTKSVGPPAGNAITILIGRDGKSWASAAVNAVIPATSARTQYLNRFTALLPATCTNAWSRRWLDALVANDLAPPRGFARDQLAECFG